MKLRTSDTEIFYEVRGKGPDVVLLHPFPSSHTFWNGLAERLESRYRLIIPDLRGLGASEPGDGDATMDKHANDIVRLCDEVGAGKFAIAGCSIGGYIIFEMLRTYKERISAVALMNTKASADNDAAKANRYKAADEVVERGPEAYIEGMLPKLVGESTRTNRPDVVEAAKATMLQSTAKGIAAVQRGMAERKDAIDLLPRVEISALIVGGEEDELIPREELAKMKNGIRRSELKIVAKAGHLAPFEQPEEVGKLLRVFLDSSAR